MNINIYPKVINVYVSDEKPLAISGEELKKSLEEMHTTPVMPDFLSTRRTSSEAQK